ncbi:unnamed protein product [Spirodela intermedia]|uniref:Uncharacterized protein n=1 Tax=Spirodela intermedia TaxID=51605 RepID=A0A7I8ITQ7_SPIIN|nr:unnamed protein product [Spirodela intermedia]CAA6661354.1 unnamed protein product [Spirodela intermedia]
MTSAPDEHESGENRVPPGSFILRSAQQEEALHRTWYALKSPARGYTRLCFRPACGPGWPAGPPHFILFLF